ncbi:ABC transporter ATP-binding protein [Ensifer adhaerens]|jgi:multiple sugar transport system ATP-binding protein|uniref:ABC transporter ATP-binding protein n=1 Tax=Ensifer TaxID=106591 RepID=UPI0008888478|nr:MULTISPECIES: ABC transporter ATP-binding protein [Ensifer]MBD9498339.1 ABC transporter ATP-binding protein [Ensifer sp. ENS01]MBD9523221.1 ABC transporter ATP-binding protein [Ensifer sp. ENS02]MBD9558968.1 ABC transporter ATP-binding protein [Ensifer sp. ENS03]MBD9569789.1 ABC transporter ATP-binding protein [Ensifer sp. ENS08]MBD9597250.1 ABC transporter ATP-binding protein [Ensifer sp. ENS05]
MGTISLRKAGKRYGAVEIIRELDLEIADGEFVVIVGPSGCGKSTLLRMIAGLEATTDGQILINGRDATSASPVDRQLAMVFQSYALYPHMTVRQNMGFGLRLAKVPSETARAKIEAAAETLKLTPLLDRYPKELSGGQRQRVAIGRAIVREPVGFLFDEPLSNLDAALRVDMRLEIAKLHRTLGATMIYVTHDQVEAMTLADRIVVMKDGRIMQQGSPRDLYEKPANLFVAQFIGSPKMNLLPCRRDQGGRLDLSGEGDLALPMPGTVEPEKLGARPEHLALVAPETGHCRGVIEASEYLGGNMSVFVRAGRLGLINVSAPADTPFRVGEAVGIRIDESRSSLFDGTGAAIGA